MSFVCLGTLSIGYKLNGDRILRTRRNFIQKHTWKKRYIARHNFLFHNNKIKGSSLLARPAWPPRWLIQFGLCHTFALSIRTSVSCGFNPGDTLPVPILTEADLVVSTMNTSEACRMPISHNSGISSQFRDIRLATSKITYFALFEYLRFLSNK